MLTAYGFHIDFQFWAYKWGLSRSQTTWYPRYHIVRPRRLWFELFGFFLVPMPFLYELALPGGT